VKLAKKNAEYLEPFWVQFKITDMRGKIELLKNASNFIIYKRYSGDIRNRRIKFDTKKHLYTKLRFCKVCTRRAEHRHHIIAIKNGDCSYHFLALWRKLINKNPVVCCAKSLFFAHVCLMYSSMVLIADKHP